MAVEPGSVLLVVGPSGSGKSTLARGLAGLLPGQFPGTWSGSVRIDGREIAKDGSAAGAVGPGGAVDAGAVELAVDAAAAGGLHVAVEAANAPPLTPVDLGAGIVLQDPASQLVMERVGDDVAFGLENLAWPLLAMRRRVPEALASVGLTGFEDRRSTRLSGGEQQRVALAGVLAPAPGLLVLDEPTASLDPEGAEVVMRILASLREREAATIVLVDHRAELAWPLADVVLALGHDGRPIDVGPPDAVLQRSGSALRNAGIWLPEDREAVAGARTAWASRAAAAPAASVPILEFQDVRFAFPDTEPVLRDIALTVLPGERIALVGANGSGKTTLLRLALGLLRPTAGVVRLGSRSPWRLAPVQVARLAGYVVQDPELGFLADTVREEVDLGLDREQVRFAHELCERLNLPLQTFADRSPYRLSGGEQRRLSLVTGLARRPLLLALDEPTFGQDRRGHEALVAALDDLVWQGSALLAATHDERFVRDATSRRVELAGGWIIADEPVGREAAA
ncbi:MAG TPA: ABC transporter ATP-binding protein [Candidatus Binatia bacterium]|nr:ABC transporter ATP-binding protein [Candidatus Binatia bacterium]